MEILIAALVLAVPFIGGIFSKSKKSDSKKSNEEELSDELVAVISIAAHEIIKKPVVVKAIHFLDTPADTAWAVHGRFNIMNSHRL